MTVLVTGGTGYIGSHVCVELLNAGYKIVVADNLCNSSKEVINRIQKLCNKSFPFEQVDLTNYEDTENLFKKHRIDTIMHFAGLKAVAESVKEPLKYYKNNIDSALSVLFAMKKYNVKNFVFSSSATVYGKNAKVPYCEQTPVSSCSLSPYGYTKLIIENILKDISKRDLNFNAVILRYFNPVGAHESGILGEDPKGIPNNLVPYIAKVAAKKLDVINIFGNDYETPDGTCLRDFIHVVDLAKGHIAALKKIEENCGLFVCNLGTGKPTSVLEMVNMFSKVCKKKLPYVFKNRRSGDLPAFWADVSLAKKALNWEAKRDVYEMCKDTWNFQSKNPDGYKS